jgi:SAM-dependent methyltransferase
LSHRVPPYFDHLIEAFHQGALGRFVHLGHFDDPARIAPGPGVFERAQRRLDEIVLGMADLRDEQRLLDVGCGFGGTLQSIDQRHRRMWLAGINVDPRQLAICGQLEPRGSSALVWVQADGCELPFAGGSFDRVVCIEALFHFASRRQFFGEAGRVLLPGGVLVLTDMYVSTASRLDGLPGFCTEALLRDGYGPWPDLWGEDGDHRRLGTDAGLELTRMVDATEATRPSHGFTVPPHADLRRDPGHPAIRAALMLKWLHDEGRLRYVYLRFDKPR